MKITSLYLFFITLTALAVSPLPISATDVEISPDGEVENVEEVKVKRQQQGQQLGKREGGRDASRDASREGSMEKKIRASRETAAEEAAVGREATREEAAPEIKRLKVKHQGRKREVLKEEDNNDIKNRPPPPPQSPQQQQQENQEQPLKKKKKKRRRKKKGKKGAKSKDAQSESEYFDLLWEELSKDFSTLNPLVKNSKISSTPSLPVLPFFTTSYSTSPHVLPLRYHGPISPSLLSSYNHSNAGDYDLTDAVVTQSFYVGDAGFLRCATYFEDPFDEERVGYTIVGEGSNRDLDMAIAAETRRRLGDYFGTDGEDEDHYGFDGSGEEEEGEDKPFLADVVEEVIDSLDTVCAINHAGWWSYEWCHEATVKQFHIGTKTVKEKGKVKEENFLESVMNIGNWRGRSVKYDGHVTINEWVGHPEGSVNNPEFHDVEKIQIVEHYTGGEKCPPEMRSRPRATDVVYQCCLDIDVKGRKSVSQALERSDVPAWFLEVGEAQPCKYVATICVQELCTISEVTRQEFQKNIKAGIEDTEALRLVEQIVKEKMEKWKRKELTDKTLATNGMSTDGMSPTEIIDRDMKNTCVQKGEGWWTYEFCWRNGGRQFHQETVLDQKSGKLKNSQVVENSLGKWQQGGPELKVSKLEKWREREGLGTPEIVRQQQEEKRARSIAKQRGVIGNGGNNVNAATGYVPEGPFLEEEMTGGDLCVEEEVKKMKVHRSATIKYFCGPKVQLINVEETRSCHYELSVTVPGLCNLKGWRRETDRTKAVKCALGEEKD
eukprot:CAMPEP_0118646668 /NCGR_PEP_ID=MMETSP0785-20121206/8186_1 /TAXON_ID=91992 /ORGANISM="Bolidomonas pacifica, Strain CCMP 1866" /LENGTH=777 /DNA_ID=CAMNT_0006538691 /DNA_START=63 /DNA_END=2396 /DNA_ORIENTATION=+